MAYDSSEPAFPFQPVTSTGEPNEPCMGMTLRDYFAGQVLMGIAARQVVGRDARLIASVSYELADAMLEARSSNGR